MSEQKNRIRSHFKGQFSGLRISPDDKRFVQVISQRPEFQSAPRVFLFMARVHEPPVHSLWFLRPESCVFPRVNVPTLDMGFYKVSDLAVLKPGYGGVLEPVGAAVPVNRPSTSDLVLIPGIVFDRYGGRLGSGKGFYDKYLAGSTATHFGVCAQTQIIEDRLDQDTTDVRMCGLITDNGFVPVV